MNYTPTLLLATAKYAAMRAADYASSQSARRHDANSATRRDVKHKLDVECEAMARQLLLDAFPGSVSVNVFCAVWLGAAIAIWVWGEKNTNMDRSNESVCK